MIARVDLIVVDIVPLSEALEAESGVAMPE
jgi:hypothetical protein